MASKVLKKAIPFILKRAFTSRSVVASAAPGSTQTPSKSGADPLAVFKQVFASRPASAAPGSTPISSSKSAGSDALVVAIVVGIGLALLWSATSKIRCFFTWKSAPLTSVELTNGKCACSSGASALWNDRGPTPGTMCCRSKNVVNNWAKGWCVDMLEGDTCLFNDQCVSRYCKPGMTADSKCATR